MKKVLVISMLFMGLVIKAQTVDSLKSEVKVKKATIKKLQSEVAKMEAKIATFPGWKFGVFGTVGANFSRFNNWYQQGNPNSTTANIGIIANGFANLERSKFFWKNALKMNFGWVKFDDRDNPNDDSKYKTASDIFNISSLYGYKLTKHWAVSALGEYRTSVIDNFNNPSYLDLGVGATWTPVQSLTVVVHPLNYNIVFSKTAASYSSSLGTKLVVDYTRMLPLGVNFKTNFTSFISYKGAELSNWTWTNNVAYTFWKGIGLGFEFSLRQNKQEFINSYMKQHSVNYATALTKDNKLQSFWLFGLSFAL